MGGRSSRIEYVTDPALLDQIKRLKSQLDSHSRDSQQTISNLQSQLQSQLQNISNLQATINILQKEADNLKEELQKPIRERQAKMKFINDLGLKVTYTNKIILVGHKGQGKSTFLYLLGEGEKPEKSFSDGTQIIETTINQNEFCDTIGIMGWELINLLKLFVLSIYNGIPQDIVVFCQDRVYHAMVCLGALGILNPMIVSMQSNVWTQINKNRITLLNQSVKGKNIKRVKPESDLDLIYRLDDFEEFKKMGLYPITHHDNIRQIADRRKQEGINPFGQVQSLLGTTIKIQDNEPEIREILFRMIYIYEKKYKKMPKGQLAFMNNAQLNEFEKL